MAALVRLADRINEGIGHVLGAAMLLLILIQFVLVVAGAVFAVGSIWLQESRLYLNALIFLGGAGYTLKHDDHVRVDLFFRDADPLAKAWVEFAGIAALLLPFLFVLWWAGVPYVAASWAAREGSTETGGIPFVYGLKTTVLLFAATLTLQSAAVGIRAAGRIFAARSTL